MPATAVPGVSEGPQRGHNSSHGAGLGNVPGSAMVVALTTLSSGCDGNAQAVQEKGDVGWRRCNPGTTVNAIRRILGHLLGQQGSPGHRKRGADGDSISCSGCQYSNHVLAQQVVMQGHERHKGRAGTLTREKK